MSFTEFLEHKLLDQMLGATVWTAPATVYIGLSTTTPADDGSNFTEPGAGVSYARAAVTNNSTNWPNASGGSKANANAITFAAASGAGWGTLTHFGIFDQLSGGNLLATGELTVHKTVNNLDTVQFAAGALTVTLE